MPNCFYFCRKAYTVSDLVSEHALISGHPTFFFFFPNFVIFFFLFFFNFNINNYFK